MLAPRVRGSSCCSGRDVARRLQHERDGGRRSPDTGGALLSREAVLLNAVNAKIENTANTIERTSPNLNLFFIPLGLRRYP